MPNVCIQCPVCALCSMLSVVHWVLPAPSLMEKEKRVPILLHGHNQVFTIVLFHLHCDSFLTLFIWTLFMGICALIGFETMLLSLKNPSRRFLSPQIHIAHFLENQKRWIKGLLSPIVTPRCQFWVQDIQMDSWSPFKAGKNMNYPATATSEMFLCIWWSVCLFRLQLICNGPVV